MFSPELGPIWLAYLSSTWFETADPSAPMIPPTALNVAGGNFIPLFSSYSQRSFWRLERSTGLPEDFQSRDDTGNILGIVDGQLVVGARQSPPFDKGFTNIVYKVTEHERVMGRMLPKKCVMEVYWTPHEKLELIHRYSIIGQSFETNTAKTVPFPSINGIAIVSDGRLLTTNGAIQLVYFATNRFLSPKELTNLSDFKEAVELSLRSPDGYPYARSWALLLLAITIVGPVVVIVVRGRNKMDR